VTINALIDESVLYFRVEGSWCAHPPLTAEASLGADGASAGSMDEVLNIRGKVPGVTMVKLTQRRPWEEAGRALRSSVITVVVP
jgi:hypothetical protein